jgi:anti-sigma B factor antagonist
MARRGERVERSSGAAPPRREPAGDNGDAPLNGARLGVAIERATDDVCVLAVTGELDLSTIPRLEARLSAELASHHGVVIDLSRLAFIDSSGIGLLIQAHQAEGAAVHTVVSEDSQPDRVFRLTCIDRALPIFGDAETAVAAFGSDGGAG